ncbi:hypothetical protein HY488_01265 [Candidatus Woesearchaeota archaeon]|nr:hypothetical protein [Candidatus Woesearchaeota archaeon]
MIDQEALKTLKPEERITRLKEMSEERKRELQLIDALLKETIVMLQADEVSSMQEKDLLMRQLAATTTTAAVHEEQKAAGVALDERIRHAVLEAGAEERNKLAELAEAATIAGMYHAPALDPGEIRKEYTMFEGYSPFKQTGYESLWKQQEDNKFKKHESKKEERNPLLL